MATWKYGPIKTMTEDYGGMSPSEEIEYAVEYKTCADYLSVLQDGKCIAGFYYDSSRAVARMIAQWYLEYECGYSREFTDKLFKGNIKE